MKSATYERICQEGRSDLRLESMFLRRINSFAKEDPVYPELIDALTGRYFKSTLNVIFLLKFWIANNPDSKARNISRLSNITGQKAAAIDWYYHNYGGKRFPRPFLENFFEFYSKKKRTRKFVPAKTTLTKTIDLLNHLELARIDSSALYKIGSDVVFEEELFRLIEDWSNFRHRLCAAEAHK